MTITDEKLQEWKNTAKANRVDGFAACSQIIPSLISEVERQHEQLTAAREALEKFADRGSWMVDPAFPSIPDWTGVSDKPWEVAQAALAAMDNK